MITPLGELSLGALNPGAFTAIGGAQLSLNAVLPSLQAQVAGLIQAQASIAYAPPDILGQLQQLYELIVQTLLAIAQGLTTVDVQTSAIATALAELQATLGSVSAQLALFDPLLDALSLGVTAYAYDGTAAKLAPELGQYTNGGFGGGGPNTGANALVIATTSPLSWAAMQKLFAV